MPDAYVISITRRVRKIIDALERQEATRVSRAIDALAIDPRPAGCLKIQGEDNVCVFEWGTIESVTRLMTP